MRRQRSPKIVATLGPASSSPERIRALFEAGVDVFRLNFSHGTHDDHHARFEAIRQAEAETGRPIGILADMQGPKLRLGNFASGTIELKEGAKFRLDLDATSRATSAAPRCRTRRSSPRIEKGTDLLIDDGKVRLRVTEARRRFRRDRMRRRRRPVEPQGHQPAQRDPAAVGGDRKGPRRHRLCAAAGRRLDRAVLRAAARKTSPRGASRSAPPPG